MSFGAIICPCSILPWLLDRNGRIRLGLVAARQQRRSRASLEHVPAADWMEDHEQLMLIDDVQADALIYSLERKERAEAELRGSLQ